MKQKAIVILILFIICINSALAIGVTSPYWNERPLILFPGETKEASFILQNMVGENEVTLRASMVKGQEVAKLTDKSLDYTIPFGTKDTKVNMQIKAPKNDPIGSKYTVEVLFTSITQAESGQFQLGSAFQKSFDVIIQEGAITKERVSIVSWIGYIIGSIIVLIGIIFLIRRKTS